MATFTVQETIEILRDSILKHAFFNSRSHEACELEQYINACSASIVSHLVDVGPEGSATVEPEGTAAPGATEGSTTTMKVSRLVRRRPARRTK